MMPHSQRAARKAYLDGWRERLRIVRCAGVTNRDARDRLMALEVAEEANR